MRKTIIVPAAGEKLVVEMTGRSIIIEDMDVYVDADAVPTMNMRPGTSNYPLYPRSTYPNEDGIFNSIEIIGTTDSAGDEIKLFSTDECLPLNINIIFTSTRKVDFKTQFVKNVAGAGVVTLDQADLEKDGRLPSAIYVAARNFGVYYAHGVDPNSGTSLGIPLAADVDPVKFEGTILLSDLRFQNQTTGGANDAVLNVICEYG